MTTNILGKNLTSAEQENVAAYLRKKLPRIEELLSHAPEDAKILHAMCEKFPKKAAYRLALELRADGERFYVAEDDHTLTEVVDLSVDKLIHQLRSAQERSQGKSRRARGARRSMKEEVTADAEPDPAAGADTRNVFQLLQPMLPTLMEHLSNEIRKLELGGELAPGQLAPEAVVDSLVISLHDSFDERPRELSFEQWATQRATFFLRTMARSEQEVNEWVSLDGETPAAPAPTEATDAEPDDVGIPVDDMASDEDALELDDARDPGAEHERAEATARRLIGRLGSHPSDADREAFTMHLVDDLPFEEIASQQGRSAVEVELAVREMLAELRETVPSGEAR